MGDAPKNGQPKTDVNPKGAGRPRKDAPLPPPPPNEDPRDAALRAKVSEFASLKITPSVAREMGEMLANIEKTAYGVVARVLSDPRWELSPDEIEVQRSTLAMGVLVYGDLAKAWLVPIVLITGIAAPAIARVVLLPAREKSNAGAPVARVVTKA